ncbi:MULTISPECIES: DMT family transporter [unclassified Variovorax]|uniref:DMT family transporter n=1 Tax=unclassified Variovorax TaxID=663243 RepID=UPI003ED06FB4
MTLHNPALPLVVKEDFKRLAHGAAVGLLAAGIGALYTVYARWGIARGLESPDLTALRFGVAGLVTLPILVMAWRKDRQVLILRWKLWLLISLLAGTPFGLLTFGALQLAPASHSAVFPFAAMSIMGMLLGAIVLGEKLTLRKAVGITVVVAGLILVSGLNATTFTARAMLGDSMFIAAGTLWAGFGIALRNHRLDPLLATAVIAFSAFMTYIPVYLTTAGVQRLLSVTSEVFWTEALVQGLIAGAGTLFTYARMVSLLGAARAAVFPALAPGLAALMAWPLLGHSPTVAETAGLVVVMSGLIWAVTGAARR